MANLRVVIFQSDLKWEDPAGNRQNIQARLDNLLKGDHDLIVFPEMFSTGFTMNPASVAEHMDGPTVRWMQSEAKRLDATLAGSIIIKEDNNYFNRLVFAFPNQELNWYDKRHLFTLAGEQKAFKAGKERKVFTVKGWRIFPQICYDLRFPCWARNNLEYDLLLYVANWPKPRHHAWQNLLMARAIENQSFVIGVNRWGQDANGLEYRGGSAAIDYAGERLLEMENEGIQTITLSREPMLTFRSKLNFLADQDEFSINL